MYSREVEITSMRCIVFALCARAGYSWCFAWLRIDRHSFAPSRCRTAQYRRTFLPISVFLLNDLDDLFFTGAVCLTVLSEQGQCFRVDLICSHFGLSLFSLCLFSVGWLDGVGVSGLIYIYIYIYIYIFRSWWLSLSLARLSILIKINNVLWYVMLILFFCF